MSAWFDPFAERTGVTMYEDSPQTLAKVDDILGKLTGTINDVEATILEPVRAAYGNHVMQAIYGRFADLAAKASEDIAKGVVDPLRTTLSRLLVEWENEVAMRPGSTAGGLSVTQTNLYPLWPSAEDQMVAKRWFTAQNEVLLTDPRVKAITFVGSTKTGKHVYSVAAAHGKRVQAQTEAKNHALVLADCDLESTVNAVINSTYGCAGMRCMALPVIVVEEAIADRFVTLLKQKAQALKVGCAYDPDTDLGPVVNARHKQFVCSWIEKGVQEGATLVLDGRNTVVKGFEGGFFVGPTILDHVTQDMRVGQDEIFGPVTIIKRVKDFDEGLAVCNASRFGNGSAIFTQNGYYARQFEVHSQAGMVGINVGIPVPSAYFPFSGNKDSFFGDQHVLGLDGVRFFTRAKTVTKHWYDEHSRKKAVDTWEGTVER